MNSVIYSANTIIPIFLLILVGVFLKKRGVINGEFIKMSSKVVFWVALPPSLFLTVSRSDFSSIFNLKAVVVGILVTVVVFLTALISSRIICKDRSQIGAFTQAGYRGNLSIFSMAVISRALSPEAFAQGAGLLVFMIPLYNVLAVLALTGKESDASSDRRIGQQLVKILQNPLIIAILVGVVASYFKVTIPVVLERSMSSLAKMALPLALIGIGGTLHLEDLKGRIVTVVSATFLKLIISPLLTLLAAYIIGLEGEIIAVLFILTGSPVAVSAFAMATALDGDTALTADIVTISTLLSIVSIGIGLILFKSMAII